MGKTRGVHETTPELRNRMVGMYEAGLGLRQIAAAVNCSQRTVKRWLNRFDKEGTVETRERCGRKRATTVEQDEAIIRLATQTPITAAKAVLPALGLTCSVDTIRERLHKAGIHNWSPSRKYMQRIPLGDTDGAAIQQPVWRPTGTQLGKKKSSKDCNKNEKNTSTVKKKHLPRKIRARDIYVGDGSPVKNVKPSNEQEFVYPQQNAQQPQTSEDKGTLEQLLPPSQAEFGNALGLVQQTQPIYQHPGISISQAWPLDLVQGSHHYPQSQTDPLSHESSSQHDLHAPQEQQHHVQQIEQVQQVQQVQQMITDQSHDLDQQQSHVQVDVKRHHEHLHSQIDIKHHHEHLHSELTSPQISTNLASDNSNSCSSQDNNQSSSSESKQNKDTSKESGEEDERQKRKKKGGKAKGTLETTFELRNRMIGMSEAGLSTLSIALAIDRSERTVKRWLERWHKEGNVHTKERKGRRRITTKEQDEAIVAMATQQPLTAAKHVAPALGLKCSVDTIRERLHKAGIHSWKLGKKQGEGNAVHTVHLWQPSGNRPNKPKILGEKKKKLGSNKRRDQSSNSIQKRSSTKKMKIESNSMKIEFNSMKIEFNTMKMAPPPTEILPEQSTALPFHNPATSSNIMQSVHNIPGPPPPLAQPQAHPPPGPPPPAPQSMQPMGTMMQQRPDCRLAPAIVPPVSNQGNTGVAYPSCMVGSNSHAGHMEQSDPLNYEPYIWSF